MIALAFANAHYIVMTLCRYTLLDHASSLMQAVDLLVLFFFFSSRRRHTRLQGDWSSDVCSSDLDGGQPPPRCLGGQAISWQRPVAARPGPGGQHRPHEGRRPVPVPARVQVLDLRSEERRVGKECRSRWSPYH